MRVRSSISVLILVVLFGVFLANCGGGGGGQPPSGTSYYDIGGVVSGLTNTGSITLQNNGGDSLTVVNNGNFRFTTRLTSGATYSVSILTAPVDQNCALLNAVGTVPGASVTSVFVSCADITVVPGPSVTSLDEFDAIPPGDDSIETASTITVGDIQQRTLFNEGDVDVVKVALDAGVPYEISVNKLSSGSDTYVYLLNTDGTTTLVTEATDTTYSDDYLGLGSMFRTTPSQTGTYYIKVMTYKKAQYSSGMSADLPYGIAAYTLAVHTIVDSDGDGVSAYYDCDDNNELRYPWKAEIPGDGIDQDCTGTDQPSETTADKAEPDNDVDHAREILGPAADPFEIRYRQDMFVANGRTIHQAGDQDWFVFTLPAYGAAEIATVINKVSGPNDLKLSVYEGDGTTLVTDQTNTFFTNPSAGAPFIIIANETPSEATYYAVFEATDTGNTGFYVPYIIYYGTDADGDSFYTLDFYLGHDCNDADQNIIPFEGGGTCGSP